MPYSQVGSISMHCSCPRRQICAQTGSNVQQTLKGNRTRETFHWLLHVQSKQDDSQFPLSCLLLPLKKKKKKQHIIKRSKYLNSAILGMSTSRFQCLHTLSLHQLSYALSRRTQNTAFV